MGDPLATTRLPPSQQGTRILGRLTVREPLAPCPAQPLSFENTPTSRQARISFLSRRPSPGPRQRGSCSPRSPRSSLARVCGPLPEVSGEQGPTRQESLFSGPAHSHGLPSLLPARGQERAVESRGSDLETARPDRFRLGSEPGGMLCVCTHCLTDSSQRRLGERSHPAGGHTAGRRWG